MLGCASRVTVTTRILIVLLGDPGTKPPFAILGIMYIAKTSFKIETRYNRNSRFSELAGAGLRIKQIMYASDPYKVHMYLHLLYGHRGKYAIHGIVQDMNCKTSH